MNLIKNQNLWVLLLTIEKAIRGGRIVAKLCVLNDNETRQWIGQKQTIWKAAEPNPCLQKYLQHW